jgi:hypothetical protein
MEILACSYSPQSFLSYTLESIRHAQKIVEFVASHSVTLEGVGAIYSFAYFDVNEQQVPVDAQLTI